jgi:hypothetical protein
MAPSYPSSYLIIQPQALDTILVNHYKEHNYFKPSSINLNLIVKCIQTSLRLGRLMCLLIHRLHPPLILRQRMV